MAIAGPASNFLQALLWAGVASAFLHLGIWDETAKGMDILIIGVLGNLFLMAFNLIPIPPLDGSRVVLYFLRGEARKSFAQLERYGMFIILGLILFSRDTFRAILYPIFNPALEFVLWITAMPDAFLIRWMQLLT